jgi:hypothetical protein
LRKFSLAAKLIVNHEVTGMRKALAEENFLCIACKRHFDLKLMYTRDKKHYCPTCYIDQYDSWEGTDLNDHMMRVPNSLP